MPLRGWRSVAHAHLYLELFWGLDFLVEVADVGVVLVDVPPRDLSAIELDLGLRAQSCQPRHSLLVVLLRDHLHPSWWFLKRTLNRMLPGLKISPLASCTAKMVGSASRNWRRATMVNGERQELWGIGV